MKMKIAILAACASTLAIAHADVARANYAGGVDFKGSISTKEIKSAPVIRLAKGHPQTAVHAYAVY